MGQLQGWGLQGSQLHTQGWESQEKKRGLDPERPRLRGWLEFLNFTKAWAQVGRDTIKPLRNEVAFLSGEQAAKSAVQIGAGATELRAARALMRTGPSTEDRPVPWGMGIRAEVPPSPAFLLCDLGPFLFNPLGSRCCPL